MISKIVIEDLFGISGNNKTISFNDDLTVLVGKNGSGKTTVLNILNAILTKNFEKLFPYNFSKIHLWTTRGEVVCEKENNGLHIYRPEFEKRIKDIKNNISKLTAIYNDSKIPERTVDLFLPIDSPRYSKSSDHFDFEFESIYFPTYRRIETTIENLLGDKFDKYIFSPRVFEEVEIDFNEKTNTVTGLSNKDVNKIIFDQWRKINTQEKIILNKMFKEFLFSFFTSEYGIKINFSEISTIELKENLLDILHRTGLVPRTESEIPELEAYIPQLQWANTIISSTHKSESENEPNKDFQNAVGYLFNTQNIYNLLNIFKEKRLEIDQIYLPLTSFKDTIQEFFSKRVEINEGELLFNENGKFIHFENLSAGEKQLVAIFIYLRFVKPKAVVLFDEPELSLHLNWQRKFLSALMSGNKNQFVISTHSPFIISKYRNKIFVLGEEGE